MAQEPRAPWSRWDYTGVDFFPLTRLRDSTDDATWFSPRIQQLATTTAYGNRVLYPTPVPVPAPPTATATVSSLLAKEYNQFDSSFFNCIYGIPNEAAHLIEKCHIDVGCCETTCCDSGWRFKYGWALFLLFLFCAAVAIVSLIWLAAWLMGRRMWPTDSYRHWPTKYDAYNNRENYLDIGSQVSPKITPAPFSTATMTLPRVSTTAKSIAGAEFRYNRHVQNAFKY